MADVAHSRGASQTEQENFSWPLERTTWLEQHRRIGDAMRLVASLARACQFGASVPELRRCIETLAQALREHHQAELVTARRFLREIRQQTHDAIEAFAGDHERQHTALLLAVEATADPRLRDGERARSVLAVLNDLHLHQRDEEAGILSLPGGEDEQA